MPLDSVNPDTVAAVAAVPPIGPNTREDAAGTFHDVVHQIELNAIAELQGFADDATAIINDLDERVAALEADPGGGGGPIGRTLTAVFDGGSVSGTPQSVAVSTAVQLRAPYALTLTGWTLIQQGATGDVEIDVRSKPFASGSFASLTGGSEPSASGGGNAEGGVTGWTTSIAAGDLVEFVISARTGLVPRVTFQLQATQA
jgi:hypothetical protein